ncbi:MAG: sulfoxide reductase heme-binding subunit YedZ [Alphaproteobacteria bacterium]|jgi:sulfoxide reductase heme-binding subunit YedZ
MKFFIPSSPTRVKPVYLLVARLLVHATSVVWLLYILFQGFTGALSGDPVQYLLDFTGIGTLNLLLLSLTISPLAEYLKFGQIIRLRKTLGVYAATYALSHLGVFIAFELQFEWALIVSEIIERPYITVGFAALLILTSLLVTSLTSIKVRMGKAWQRLHKWVYVALGLGLLHFLWSIKANELQPYIYIMIGLVLLIARKRKLKNFFK